MVSNPNADADPDWEYAPLRIPSDVTRVNAAVRLSLHTDGSRQVLLRRKRRTLEPVPMPGLFA